MEQCSQSTPIEDGKFDFNDTVTSLSEKLSSSVIESASENENSSDNETLPNSPIKQICKRRCIQLLCAGECSEDELPESYERNLDTVETARNNEEDDTENFFEKAKEEQDIQSDSKKKGTMFYPSKLAKEIIVIKSDDE